MANPLRESSNQSAQLTEASLPYIQQGADFMGGVPRGVQIAGGLQQQHIAAQQLVMQESQHEAEMQDLALRGQLYQGELALRREQAMTRSAEAAAELQWRQTQNALSQMQQNESRVRMQRDVATLPPRKRKDGMWEVADYGDGGSVVWSTVEESDPRVQDYVGKIASDKSQNELRNAQAESYRANAEWLSGPRSDLAAAQAARSQAEATPEYRQLQIDKLQAQIDKLQAGAETSSARTGLIRAQTETEKATREPRVKLLEAQALKALHEPEIIKGMSLGDLQEVMSMYQSKLRATGSRALPEEERPLYEQRVKTTQSAIDALIERGAGEAQKSKPGSVSASSGGNSSTDTDPQFRQRMDFGQRALAGVMMSPVWDDYQIGINKAAVASGMNSAQFMRAVNLMIGHEIEANGGQSIDGERALQTILSRVNTGTPEQRQAFIQILQQIGK